MAKKKRQGHYCMVCGEIKANEKFSGKGHALHICKSCQSLSKDKKEDMLRGHDMPKEIWNEKKYATDNMPEKDVCIFDDVGIDFMPEFPEKKKFKELDKSKKAFLRDYIYSEIIEHWESSGKVLNENELIEIKKRMIVIFEEECQIIIKNDASLRQFFHDNATSIINKLQKKT